MSQAAFDPDALITMFEKASAQGSAKLRQSVADATLQALQGRELTLKNMRSVLAQMSKAAESGLAKNMGAPVDVQAMLDQAVAGMDDALVKAVDANRVALERLVSQGADLREQHMKKALTDLEKMEDMLLDTVKKSAAAADKQTGAAWQQVLEKLNAGGTLSGAQAATTAEQFAAQMQQSMRQTRAAGLRAAQALAESYTAMVSGVLIGMSDAMQQGGKSASAKKKG